MRLRREGTISVDDPEAKLVGSRERAVAWRTAAPVAIEVIAVTEIDHVTGGVRGRLTGCHRCQQAGGGGTARLWGGA